jgi:hypothetical protein
VHEPETAANDAGTSEKRTHLLGRRICRNIEILGLKSQYQIAGSAANDKGGVSSLLQTGRDVQRAFVDMVTRNAMLLARNNMRTMTTVLRAGSGIWQGRNRGFAATEDAAKKFTDHAVGNPDKSERLFQGFRQGRSSL